MRKANTLYLYPYGEAAVIGHCNQVAGLQYEGTDTVIYNGEEFYADVYIDIDNNVYAVVQDKEARA
ncbi:MAG: hypothetical protein IKY89_05515 [Alistipes sp.]|nr:hypothetical protein [Alistipes sp.]